jgi:hypothetical protein
LEKVSPPFEGGVAGTIDYLIFTKFIPRPGWLIYSIINIFKSMKIKIIFKSKNLKLSDHLKGTDPVRQRQQYGGF